MVPKQEGLLNGAQETADRFDAGLAVEIAHAANLGSGHRPRQGCGIVREARQVVSFDKCAVDGTDASAFDTKGNIC